ncbi:hypothetical protein [Devosia sp. A369]
MANNDPIYVVFRKKEGRFVGHSIAFERPNPEAMAEMLAPENIATETKSADQKVDQLTFPDALSSFLSIMSTYRNMIPFTIEVSPMVSGMIASSEIGRFVLERGQEIEEISND